MHLIITTRNRDTADEICCATRAVDDLGMHIGSFETLRHFDCVATAGNSFGLMDAGMDLAVCRFFGIDLQERIQNRILEEYCGEQPVGTAFIVETNRIDHPY